MSKKLPLFYTLMIALFSSAAFSQSTNVCDDIAKTGATEEQIADCQKDNGISDYAKQYGSKPVTQKTDTAASTDQNTKDNLEIKEFTEDELVKKAYGKFFVATRIETQLGYNYALYVKKEKRITEGDSLCHRLGYEKVIQSKVSEPMIPELVDGKGLFIDTVWLLGTVKKPELYIDKDRKYLSRRYKGITCAKRIDPNLDPKNDILKALAQESIEIVPNPVEPKDKKDKATINDSKRNSEEKPSGYHKPDWAKDDPKTTSGK